jgi:DNA-binding transcriptional LysR family regulator
MELLQLQYFLQLADLQHVTKTAQRLHVSQPSLSATIKKLEAELGVPLFIRKGRNIALSSYGEAFKVYVEEIFLSLENGKQAIARMKNEDNGVLNLGLLSPYVWNELFFLFNDNHPDIKINRQSIEGYRFETSLLNGDIDFYLGGLNQIEAMDTSRLQYVPLYEDNMVLLVNKDHPLAARKEIDLRECRDEPFINLAAETNLQQFINHLFQQAGFEPKIVMTCDYTLRDQMVAEGHGVSITTRLGAQKSNVSGTVAIPITYPAEKRKLGLVWRKKRVFSVPMEKFYNVANHFYSDIKKL